MKDTILRHVYVSLIGVFTFSALVYLFMIGFSPFGVRFAWDSASSGVPLALITEGGAEEYLSGSKIAIAGDGEYAVRVYTVTEAIRADGALTYRVNHDTEGARDVGARDVVGGVVVSIPVFGVWVRALAHPVGTMALLGVPLTMLVVDLILTLMGAVHGILMARRRGLAEEEFEEEQRADAYDAYEEGAAWSTRSAHEDRRGVEAHTAHEHTVSHPSERSQQEALYEGMSVRLPRRPSHRTRVQIGAHDLYNNMRDHMPRGAYSA